MFGLTINKQQSKTNKIVLLSFPVFFFPFLFFLSFFSLPSPVGSNNEVLEERKYVRFKHSVVWGKKELRIAWKRMNFLSPFTMKQTTLIFFGVSPTTHTKKAIPSPPTDSHQETYNSGFKLSFHPTKKTRSDNILNRRNLRSCTIDDDSFLSALPFFPGNRVSPCFVSPNQKLIKEKKAVPIRRWCPNQPPQHYTGGVDPAAACIFFFL